MPSQAKPVICVSKCLTFDPCRFNGQKISSDFVSLLKPHVSFLQVCPEVEIGLGIPRDPVRIVRKNDGNHLVQKNSLRDYTADMAKFSASYLDSLEDVDGFILKASSPSCGINITKIYPSMESSNVIDKGHGLFGGAVLEKFPNLVVEDEGRLRNFNIREHFLTGLYLNAKFRQLTDDKRIGNLVKFHSDYKYLFMSINQKRLRNLGRIVANHNNLSSGSVFSLYRMELTNLLQTMPKRTTRINALHHVMGYFSSVIGSKEKAFILESIENYRNKKVPFSVPLNLLRSCAIRSENAYIENQTFFEPYPVELMQVTDSGKGRSLQ